MEHYKFIHFFWHDDLKFSSRVVKMINNAEYGFVKEDHLFVTPYKKVYTALSNYANVVLYEMKDPFSAQMVNHFAPYGDWLFLHSIPNWYKAFGIRKKFQKKVIWRTWGHDAVLFVSKKKTWIKQLFVKAVNFIKKREVRRFYAVGTSGNYVDVIDIKRNYGNVNMLAMPYVEKTDGDSQITQDVKVSSSLNIMVGHSGSSLNNHIDVLRKLKKFENQDIRIYLVLSYGNPDYIKMVSDYVKTNWTQKVELVTGFMPLTEFEKFCSKMDLGVFDGLQSYAIGNISILASMRKKLIVNRKGLWHQAFSDKGFPHMCTDDLESCSFEELKKKLVFEKEYYEGIDSKPFEKKIEGWKAIFSELSSIRHGK